MKDTAGQYQGWNYWNHLMVITFTFFINIKYKLVKSVCKVYVQIISPSHPPPVLQSAVCSHHQSIAVPDQRLSAIIHLASSALALCDHSLNRPVSSVNPCTNLEAICFSVQGCFNINC